MMQGMWRLDNAAEMLEMDVVAASNVTVATVPNVLQIMVNRATTPPGNAMPGQMATNARSYQQLASPANKINGNASMARFKRKNGDMRQMAANTKGNDANIAVPTKSYIRKETASTK